MLWVGADDPHHTTATNDLALVANPLDRCSNFHVCLSTALGSRRWALGLAAAASQILTNPGCRAAIVHGCQTAFVPCCLCALGQLLYDPPSAAIHRRELHTNPITDQHPDEISIRSVGDVRRHYLSPVQPHEIQSTRKLLRHYAVHDADHIRHQSCVRCPALIAP